MKKSILLTMALLCASAFCWGQQMQNLPNDPATKVGKLDNGMTYYIRHNELPAQRADFYLATNVGALQETPDQDGLAHFLEHMCFNGTKNFPGKGILNWLESIGASFGGNVNASTGVEQTIYLLNNIPLIRPTVVDTCILIMHDYSHFVTCDPEEIEKERGVILEEKRTRNTASWRMWEKCAPYMYGDTKYATTNIIGSEENLKTFKPESLTNFYHTWYIPSNQALIVVGDIDVDAVEAQIKATFADIPAVENPAQKTMYPIPDNEEPVVGVITDPEAQLITWEILWKSEARPEALNSTAVGFMTDILQDIVSQVMNERFNDLASQPDVPFLGASFGIGNACETMDIVSLDGNSKEGKALETLELMLTEAEKMTRFGFTDAEVERAKTEILSRFETKANKASSRKNPDFIQPMISNFFDNYSFMDPAGEYELAKMIMPQLQAAVINQVAQQVLTRENMIVLYEAPEREGIVTPTEAEIRDIIAKVAASEIEQGAGEDIPTAFLDASKLKGSAVKKSSAGIYGSTVYTLKNGVKVILLPTDYEKDKITFRLFKKGGNSLISDADVYSMDSNIFSLYTNLTGISDFSATTVSKMLAGKQLGVSPFINSFTHGISGQSTPKDLETALQMAYLYFAEPRFDETEYDRAITQLKTVLPNLESQPDYALQKSVYETIYDSPRRYMISMEVLEKANLETLEKNYRNLFADAAGATFVMVGDFSIDEALPLVQKYVGSIAKGKKASDWKYCNDGFINRSVLNDFKTKMQTPKVTVVQAYKVDRAYTVQDEVNINALSYILNMVYTETLREDEGGTYGASAVGNASRSPYEANLIQVAFETNNDQADRLRELAVAGLKNIAENGPDAEQFDKAVKNLEKNIPEQKLRNAYWTQSLVDNSLYGGDGVAEYEAAVKALTPEAIKACAAAFLAGDNYEIVMRPE